MSRGGNGHRSFKVSKFKGLVRKIGVIAFVAVNVLSITLTPTSPALAASFTFTQNDWAVSADSSATAGHTGGAAQTGVQSFYSTSSSYLTTGADLTIATSSGSFAQTNWSSVNQTTTAAHTTDRTGWTSASTTDSQIDYTGTAGSLKLTAVPGSVSQTNDGSTATGFNYTGSATSTTFTTGSGDAASVQLNVDSGTGADGAVSVIADACSGTGVSGTAPDCTIAGGTYNYTTFLVDASTTLTVTGTTGLVVKATGTVTINGTISANGGAGQNGNNDGTSSGIDYAGGGGGGGGLIKIISNEQITIASTGIISANGGAGGSVVAGGIVGTVLGGTAGAGGSAGGNAGLDGQDGFGIGGGNGGLYCGDGEIRSGSGGGHGGTGSISDGCAGDPLEGIAYDDATMGGSGGGGGGSSAQRYATAAGGGSGGRIEVISKTTVVNGGIIRANGGAGGGGRGIGGGGGGGRINLSDGDGVVAGTATVTLGTGGSGGSAGVVTQLTPIYAPTGTYTSGVLDFGGGVNVTTIGWTETKPASTNITMEARAGNVATPDGTWTAWTAVTNGADTGATFDGNRYIQYRATLTTSGAMTATPTLDSVTVSWQTLANYNFSLSPAPSSNEIVEGAASTIISTIMVTVENPQDPSIIDPINFSAIVSPSGPSISFSSSSCLPSSGTCTVGVYASSVSTGNYIITIKGTNASATYPNGLMQDILFPLTVSPALDFSLALSLGAGEAIRGYPVVSNVQTILTVQYNFGADEIVSFSSDAPAGINFDPSPTGCSSAPISCASTITMSAEWAAPAGDIPITITGTAALSGVTKTTLFTLRVRDPLAYSLSPNPLSAAVFQGNGTSAMVTATYGGYPAGSESVTFANFSSVSDPGAFSSVPGAGVISVGFVPGACALSQAQTTCMKSVNFSTSSNTTPGSYAITISGISFITGTVETTTYTLNVSGPFDFVLGYPIPPCATASTCVGTVEQAASINVDVIVTSPSAMGETVSFSITGLPANTTYSTASTPAPCVPSSGVSCAVTLTISPGITAPIGTFAINIIGTSSQQTHSLPYTLTVAQGFTFDVSLSSSSGVAVRGGSAESVIASVTLLTGTGKPVALSVTGGEGSGVDIQYPSGQSCTPNCARPIMFSAPTSAAWCAPDGICTYNMVITGTYGTQTVQKVYTLAVVDPFDFSFALSSTQGSIMQGGNDAPCAPDEVLNIPTGKCDKVTVATVNWLTGGSGTETISISASVIPSPAPVLLTDIVQFNPSSITGLDASSTPLYSTVTLTAPPGLASNSYTVIIIATSGTLAKTKTYNFTVGTTLDFSLSLAPDNERVMQGASSASVAITALNNLAQPASSDISFTIGDTSKYKLPKDVTVAWDTPQTCTLGAPLNATCVSALTFVVGPAAVDGTYLIPIVGQSGFVNRIIYYTLKVGPLDLVNYESPNFMTDAHQRPRIGFTWSPPAVFAGDTVQFDAASSTVYITAQPGYLADTPASAMNADFNWSFVGITGGSTLINPQVLYQNSGIRDISLTVTDAAGGCYTSTSSATEPCACTASSAVPKIEVSKPRPSFREITPQ